MAAGIQSEIKQSRPFSSLAEEAFIALQRTADQLAGQTAGMMKPYGLSPTQYNCLRILRGAGKDGLSCNQIGERMIQRDPDITRLVARLERRGLVRRSRGTEDRRVIRVRSTPAGLALLRSMDQPVKQFQKKQLGRLGNARLRSLIRLLEEARNAAGISSNEKVLKEVS